MTFLIDLFSNPFLQNALLAGVLISLSAGIMGSYVVIKKITSLAGSVSHSILGGIGLFAFLNFKHPAWFFSPAIGAFLAAILSAFLIGFIHLKHAQKEEAAVSAIWSAGMAIGVIFISFLPSYNVEFSEFLFGNILFISKADLLMLLGLNIIILLVVIAFWRPFLAVCFDEESAKLQKIPIKSYYLFLLSLISLSIVLLIQIIGIILVIALLTIPPTVAGLFLRRLPVIMIFSVLLSALLNLGGTFISYSLNFPPGATIALLAAVIYALALLWKKQKTLHPTNSSSPH
ncbi:MAG: metal ABC transporter permease [Parachlamydiales bacterium]|jgi:zinc transport system permease protein